MLSEIQVWTVAFLAGLIWLALVVVGVISAGFESVWIFADVIPLLLVVALLFERWGWRWSILHPHFVHVPVLRGTWMGELESLWEDPTTRQRPAKKTVYLTIEQTLTTVRIRLMSDESASEQVAGTITKTLGRHAVSAIYVNTPTIERRDASRIHYGGLVLAIHGSPPRDLSGEYWTERKSTGKLSFSTRSSVIAETFDEAQSLSYR